MRVRSALLPASLLLTAAVTAAAGPAARPQPSPAAEPFALSDVRLLPGPFRRAMGLDAAYLLSLDTNRLLAGYRGNAGIGTAAKAYGGWESRGLGGQSLGHYLSACSMMYASTGDAAFKGRVAGVVAALGACQDAAGDGFLGGMPDGRDLFARLARGEIRTDGGFGLNHGWVPWYNEHKLFAGLRDAWLYTGDPRAKAVLVKLGDWAEGVCRNLDDGQMQQMLGVEQGGMMETLADLYAITGDRRYLALSERFWHRAALDPLAAGQDRLTGLHANTNIPKVIGAARLYELTGEGRFRTTAETFWNAVVHDRSFVTGSNSDREHFFPIGLEAKKLGPETGESCNVYNMLKLTGHLADWTGRAEYYDFYERALFNHVLGSIDPDSGMCTYFQALEPGRFKVYGTPADSFWCCTGTGMESHAKYGSDVYARGTDGRSLNVNLFIASELTWVDKGLTLRQETDFPGADTTRLRLTLARPTRLALRVRVPGWADRGIDASGAATAHAGAGSGYLTLDRTWLDGDAVTVRLPMGLRLHRAADDPTMAAAVYGPIVLAAQLGRADFPDADRVADHTSLDHRPIPAGVVPTIVTAGGIDQWLAPVDGRPLHFRTAGVGRPHDAEFAPLYQTHHQRYAVYVRTVTPPQYEAVRQQAAAADLAARVLASRTVDAVVFGEQQSEQDHAIASDRSNTGTHNDRPWRDTTGYFSVRLKLRPGATQVLRCTYWGGDVGRTFDIKADGKLLATQAQSADHPEQFYDVEYPLPATLTADHDAVTVEFRPRPGSTAGVFAAGVLVADDGQLMRPTTNP